MRHIFMLIMIFGFTNLFASQVDTTTAKEVAIRYIEARRPSPNEIQDIQIENLDGTICFYAVNFKEGGWVLVSASKIATPILGYSLEGSYSLSDDKPDVMRDFILSYKRQISESKLTKTSKKIEDKWGKLLMKDYHKSAIAYIPGRHLLKRDAGSYDDIRYGQSANNSGTCTPSYNALFQTASGDCNCDGRVPAGCGPVAMAQILMFWQWPTTIDWVNIPNYLTSATGTVGAEAAQEFLYSLDYVNFSHFCAGTAAFINTIEEALIDDLQYESAKKLIRANWNYGSAWCDLLRSEIDLGRPVIYRGDESALSASKHTFIVDGYEADDPDIFGFNFGHGGNTYTYSFLHIDNITPYIYDWTKLHMAITGISPTIDEVAPDDLNIYSVSYSTVSGVVSEDAQQNIALPDDYETLTVNNGGELTFTAGNTVTLKTGFSIESGSRFLATINPGYSEELDIYVPSWPASFSPDGDGVDDELLISVYHADSWEFEAFDDLGQKIFQSAGLISSNSASVWDGSNKQLSCCGDDFTCTKRFKNSYGRSEENTYTVTADW